ncbi:hypothetical protein [Metaclostridioides mangenotii]|uniref:hypothetical protein n=2 Tax=Metaclostridioides mangenotii TaxID=1540 RepID=UPI0004634697|nr:hypothetical protein [Clostridioides mangenotii]
MCALPYITRKIDDYDFHKSVSNYLLGGDKKYTLEMFCETSRLMLLKGNELPNIESKISLYDRLEEDYIHDIENEKNYSVEEKVKIFDELQIARRERRKLKHRRQICDKINRLVTSMNIKKAHLDNLLNENNKLKEIAEKKPYNKRTDDFERDEWQKQLKKFNLGG